MIDTGSIISSLLIALLILLVIFFVCREIFCWYWKINASLGLLEEIRDLLATRTVNASPIVPSPAAEPLSQDLRPQPPPPPPAPAGCAECGAINVVGAKFCEQCGSSLK